VFAFTNIVSPFISMLSALTAVIFPNISMSSLPSSLILEAFAVVVPVFVPFTSTSCPT